MNYSPIGFTSYEFGGGTKNNFPTPPFYRRKGASNVTSSKLSIESSPIITLV